MSVAHKAFKGASWLALFKLASQLFSWMVTILVARLLIPDDYGLYAIAFIVTGYAGKFSQLGLGSAIIQKQHINNKELSSVFWFSFITSVLFAITCFPISYLTAYIFNDPRIIPLTQTASILFIISGLIIIPYSLLKKELGFKQIGQIELISVFVSGISMLIIAYMGGGVWTLIGGRIIIQLTTLVLLFSIVKWYPQLHFNFHEAKSYIKFGIIVAGGGSLYYIFENSDKYFAGRAWGTTLLGYYSFALTLAKLPTEKIIVLINQVSFPAFSKLLGDKDKFNKFYLDIIKVTATIIIPLFVGGYLVGGDLIRVLLGDKWTPIIYIFEWLCLSQIITAFNAYNNFVHDARGNPMLGFYFNLTLAVTMSISFYFAVQFGLNAIIVPWFTVYLFISIFWIVFTLREIEINLNSYIARLYVPIMATLIMSAAIYCFGHLATLYPVINQNLIYLLIGKILVGISTYVLYLWIFDRKIFYSIRMLRAA